jgi:lysophospholipase
MIEIAGLRHPELVRVVSRLARIAGLKRAFVYGGNAIAFNTRPFAANPVSSDPVRYQRTAAILEAAPELGLGSPTYGWLNAAFKVTDRLNDPAYPESLRQPMLIIAAGKDLIVSTPATERFATRLRAGSHQVIAGCLHEVLMERDVFRAQFWAAFDAFIPGSAP